ncbi:MAG TPA: hypothetical protein VL475_14450 [Planctomycetaceae bacterium]|nr:hypothetical protein [Planctomycetaceae bacterium]
MQTKQRGTAAEEPMTVEERLIKLEKSVRLWRFASIGLGAAVAMALAGVAMDHLGLRGTVRAKKFVVLNEKGVAVEIENSPEGDGLISLHDSKGLPRVLLGNSQKGYGTMELYGGSEQKIVFLGGSGSGGQIALYNNEKKKVVDLQATRTNCGAVVVSDFDGRLIQHLSGERR